MVIAISIAKASAKLCRSDGSFYSPRLHLVSSPRQPFCFFIASLGVSSVSESQSTSTLGTSETKRRSLLSKWLLFLPGAITFGLGTWQLFRREDKIKILEYRQQRLEMEPLKWNKVLQSSKDLDALEFRKVICRGIFDEEKSIYVGPRSRSISGVTENGYYVIMPLLPIPDDPESLQSPVLVSRGWVPCSWKNKFLETSVGDKLPLENTPQHAEDRVQNTWWRFWTKEPQNVKEQDQVPALSSDEVVGVVRGSEKPSIFVPANEPHTSQWFYVDVPAIAHTCGLPEDTIYLEDINEDVNPSNPYPLPKDVNTFIRSSVMPQDHLNYTFTWYSLSTAVTFMAYKRLRSKRSWG